MEIPHEKLDPETLTRVIEEIVTREGTEYGDRVFDLQEKVAQASEMLRSRKAVLLFDPDTESLNIVVR
ncbi:MAG: YheU family protein [Proteobacteria bacterium]|nr:YheU family protein [Pseudomonadota bacterium]